MLSCTRPRIEGAREDEIFAATLAVLMAVGYDRLTMDAVAHRARASKATLYRRWESKARLVIDALISQKGAVEVPDTGTLRGDLLAMHAPHPEASATPSPMGAVLTAMACDQEFSQHFREAFIAPKIQASTLIFERALARGEISETADRQLLGPAVAGIILHRQFVLGEAPTFELVRQVIDEIILPAAHYALPISVDATTHKGN